jgi:hypothetical protein
MRALLEALEIVVLAAMVAMVATALVSIYAHNIVLMPVVTGAITRVLALLEIAVVQVQRAMLEQRPLG